MSVTEETEEIGVKETKEQGPTISVRLGEGGEELMEEAAILYAEVIHKPVRKVKDSEVVRIYLLLGREIFRALKDMKPPSFWTQVKIWGSAFGVSKSITPREARILALVGQRLNGMTNQEKAKFLAVILEALTARGRDADEIESKN